MAITQGSGLPNVPPLALSLVIAQLQKVAVINGVQGYVKIPETAFRGGTLSPAYTITIKFPLRVYGRRYPATCLNQDPYIVDVSYIEEYCSSFASDLWGSLQTQQQLYIDINTALNNFFGVPISRLEFTVPKCY